MCGPAKEAGCTWSSEMAPSEQVPKVLHFSGFAAENKATNEPLQAHQPDGLQSDFRLATLYELIHNLATLLGEFCEPG
jgi:hypothetical protein